MDHKMSVLNMKIELLVKELKEYNTGGNEHSDTWWHNMQLLTMEIVTEMVKLK